MAAGARGEREQRKLFVARCSRHVDFDKNATSISATAHVHHLPTVNARLNTAAAVPARSERRGAVRKAIQRRRFDSCARVRVILFGLDGLYRVTGRPKKKLSKTKRGREFGLIYTSYTRNIPS